MAYLSHHRLGTYICVHGSEFPTIMASRSLSFLIFFLIDMNSGVTLTQQLT
jgi:hypothetical protein